MRWKCCQSCGAKLGLNVTPAFHDTMPLQVGLIEIFRRRRRLHLVFEFIDHTALNELEAHPQGLPLDSVKRITFQVRY
jgi:hypothetical protein